MKKVYFLALTLAMALASCNQKSQEDTPNLKVTHKDSTMEHTTTAPAEPSTAMYSCPMHPEVQGKKDSECPKCGMKLSVPVTKKEEK